MITENRVNVLIIEDLKIAQVCAFNVFKQLNCHVHIVTNGTQAIMQIIKVNYDIIFIDIQLPDINGFELARTIRLTEKRRHRIPLIAVTANSNEELESKTKEAGFDSYMIKPLTIETVRHILSKYLNKTKLKIIGLAA